MINCFVSALKDCFRSEMNSNAESPPPPKKFNVYERDVDSYGNLKRNFGCDNLKNHPDLLDDDEKKAEEE